MTHGPQAMQYHNFACSDISTSNFNQWIIAEYCTVLSNADFRRRATSSDQTLSKIKPLHVIGGTKRNRIALKKQIVRLIYAKIVHDEAYFITYFDMEKDKKNLTFGSFASLHGFLKSNLSTQNCKKTEMNLLAVDLDMNQLVSIIIRHFSAKMQFLPIY